jgi:hypothetical protein
MVLVESFGAEKGAVDMRIRWDEAERAMCNLEDFLVGR